MITRLRLCVNLKPATKKGADRPLNLGVFIRYAVFDLCLDRMQATLADENHSLERVRLKTDVVNPLITRNQKRMTN